MTLHNGTHGLHGFIIKMWWLIYNQKQRDKNLSISIIISFLVKKLKSHWCIVTPVLINILTSSKPTSSSMAATSWGSGIAPGGAHSSRKENLSMPDLIRNLSTNFFSFTIMASFSASSTWVVSFCFHSSKAQANCKSTFYIIKWQSMTCKNSFKSDW